MLTSLVGDGIQKPSAQDSARGAYTSGHLHKLGYKLARLCCNYKCPTLSL